MCEETNYPVIVVDVYHTWTEEKPGDYYYTWGYQVDCNEDIKLEIDLNEDPYIKYYEEGLTEEDIIAEALFDYYYYGCDDKWTVQYNGSMFEVEA